MDKVIHPVIIDPPVTGYLHHAYVLSITLNYPQLLPWFHSNYIQLYYYQNGGNKLNFYSPFDIFGWCPCLSNEYEDKKKLLDSGTELKPYITNYIKEGYYLCTYLNEFYIPGKRSYKKHHLQHECLIYGYDDVNRRYSILGFNDRVRYTGAYLSYEDFNEAFINAPQDSVMLFTKINLEEKLGFDADMVKQILMDYLYSANTSRLYQKRDDFEWGIDVYEQLKIYIEKVVSDGSEMDFRYFHILWEHKKCMLGRIDYMFQNGYIKNTEYYNTYQDLLKQFLILRNIIFKYNLANYTNKLNPGENLTARVYPIIDDAVAKEKKILDKIIGELENRKVK